MEDGRCGMEEVGSVNGWRGVDGGSGLERVKKDRAVAGTALSPGLGVFIARFPMMCTSFCSKTLAHSFSALS